METARNRAFCLQVQATGPLCGVFPRGSVWNQGFGTSVFPRIEFTAVEVAWTKLSTYFRRFG